MSLHSKISNVAVTLDTIGELMKKFRQEMFDVLLFVNNLEEITISDVPRTRAGVSVMSKDSGFIVWSCGTLLWC